jgi:hypothetical protein
VSIIEFLANRKFARRALICILGGILVISFATTLYTRVHYAAVMPQSPQPQSGRIYRTMAGFGTSVYINKQEQDWVNFVDYDLMTVSGICALVLVFLVMRLKRF